MTGKKTTDQDDTTGSDTADPQDTAPASQPKPTPETDPAAPDETAPDQPEPPKADDTEAAKPDDISKPQDAPDPDSPADSVAPIETLAGAEDTAPQEVERPGSETATAPQNVETVVERRGGFLPALLGGVLAAVLGFVAARSEMLDPMLPPSWRSANNSEALAALEASVDVQRDELAALESRVSDIAIPDLAPLAERIEGLRAEIEPMTAQTEATRATLDDILARLDAVEKRPISEGVSQAAIDAYERELDRLRAAVTDQRGEVEALVAEARALDAQAQESARAAAVQAVLARLQGAIDDGLAYPGLVEELAASGVEVPAALRDNAGGVPSLLTLQTTFPDAARIALADAREGSGDADGLGAFLQRQLGARSVEPRAGDDPDAILSRAEAAVSTGQLQQALDELAALPDAAKPALADWIDSAQRRIAAKQAATALMQSQSSK